MPQKKYIVSLSLEERKELERITRKGKAPAYRINHAQILLKADINQAGGGWTDAVISHALDISVTTYRTNPTTIRGAEFRASPGTQRATPSQSPTTGW
jgi:hypothetical protein